jgi:hypothetical protein
MAMQLKPEDRVSITWQRIEAYLDTRIAELQAKLGGDMDEEQTWKFRGRIAELNALKAAGQDPITVTPSDLN